MIRLLAGGGWKVYSPGQGDNESGIAVDAADTTGAPTTVQWAHSPHLPRPVQAQVG